MSATHVLLLAGNTMMRPALKALGEGQIDVVLLDADQGKERCGEFIAEVRDTGYAGPILILTAGMSEAERDWVARQGVHGVYPKDSSFEMLVTHIRGCVSATARNLLTPPPENSRPSIKRLTRRESAVLRLLIEGSTNKEIANETESTEAAVKGIVQQLFHKTGTRMRSQLLRIALERYRDQI